ncbi:MAG: DUF1549 domain-containing protein, partial [Planctomycetaceae bacterium]
MNPTPPNEPDPPALSDADERVIDAWLGEVHQSTPAPPDLTASILRELARRDQSGSQRGHRLAPPVFADAGLRPLSPATKNRPRKLLIRAAGALALAASVALLLGGWQRLSTNDRESASTRDLARSTVPGDGGRPLPDRDFAPQTLADPSSPQPAEIAKKKVPREGVPLVRTQPLPEGPDAVAAAAPEPIVISPQKPQSSEDATVLVRFNASLADYWSRLGVVPAEPLSETEVAQRIEQRFGASPAFADQAEIASFAERLVDRLMRDVPLAAGARQKMVQQASEVIQQGERFDVLVSRWVADESLFENAKPDLLSQGLATNLLGVDAACARCHDSPVDGRFAQHDYWSLASVFAPKGRPPLFYELVDGRQKLADARVPERWVGQTAEVTDVGQSMKDQFARSLLDSPALAGALANRLWEIGFDVSLIAPASDPVAPPRDDALQASHETITQAILASHFDIRAAARLVMSSEAMQRGPSELYRSGRWRMASEEAIAKDALAQRAFAAAVPSRPRAGRENLLAMMESRIGQTPRALGSTAPVLAQPSIEAGDQAAGDAR